MRSSQKDYLELAKDSDKLAKKAGYDIPDIKKQINLAKVSADYQLRMVKYQSKMVSLLEGMAHALNASVKYENIDLAHSEFHGGVMTSRQAELEEQNRRDMELATLSKSKGLFARMYSYNPVQRVRAYQGIKEAKRNITKITPYDKYFFGLLDAQGFFDQGGFGQYNQKLSTLRSALPPTLYNADANDKNFQALKEEFYLSLGGKSSFFNESTPDYRKVRKALNEIYKVTDRAAQAHTSQTFTLNRLNNMADSLGNMFLATSLNVGKFFAN